MSPAFGTVYSQTQTYHMLACPWKSGTYTRHALQRCWKSCISSQVVKMSKTEDFTDQRRYCMAKKSGTNLGAMPSSQDRECNVWRSISFSTGRSMGRQTQRTTQTPPCSYFSSSLLCDWRNLPQPLVGFHQNMCKMCGCAKSTQSQIWHLLS